MKELFRLFTLMWAFSFILLFVITLFTGTNIHFVTIIICSTISACIAVVHSLIKESNRLFKN